MNRLVPVCLGLSIALCQVATPALACGEGMFNSGKGLAYQSYLAPRPAAVLIYTTTPATNQASLYAGLKKAGHTLTVVNDQAGLTAALAAGRYDVVITAFNAVDSVTAGAGTPAVLPVVARSERNSPLVKDRFNLVLVDGASLGQYLRAINSLVQGSES